MAKKCVEKEVLPMKNYNVCVGPNKDLIGVMADSVTFWEGILTFSKLGEDVACFRAWDYYIETIN